MQNGAPAGPVRVRLLHQAGAAAPRSEADQLKLPSALQVDDESMANPVIRSRQRLLAMLALAHSAEANGAHANCNQRDLDEALHTLAVDALRCERGSDRNRSLFLLTVLSADDTCAASLNRTEAATVLCASIDRPDSPEPLSSTELQWVLVILSELAGAPNGSFPLFAAGLMPKLRALLTAQPTASRHRLSSEQNHDYERANGVPETASFGLCYATAATLANAALHPGGADAVLRSDLLTPLLERVRAAGDRPAHCP